MRPPCRMANGPARVEGAHALGAGHRRRADRAPGVAFARRDGGFAERLQRRRRLHRRRRAARGLSGWAGGERGAGCVRRRRTGGRRRDTGPGGGRRRDRAAAGRGAAPVQLDADRPVPVSDLGPARPDGAGGQSRLQRGDGHRRGARRRLRRAGGGQPSVGALRPSLRGRALVGVRGGSLAGVGAGGGGARDPRGAALAGARQLVAGRARHRRLPRQRAGRQRRRGG